MGEQIDRILGIVQEARQRLVRIVYVLVPIFAFLITFRLVPFSLDLFGTTVPFAYPFPDPFDNVTAQIFTAITAWMLPPHVALLNVGVGDSIVVQMEIAALVTVIVGMPWIAHEAGAFLLPAFRRDERHLVRRVALPATALFAIGTTLGFVLLTPLTLRLLFRYVSAMGLAPVLGVQQFVTFVLLYSLAFGVVFELPVFVFALTRLGLVRAAAWRKHWRGAVLGALVFGMIITPDNSGITMLLVAAPMVGLYLGGAWWAGRWERRRDVARAAAGA
ncbi:MAG TPA: twin-arginine translocase subunit TatC [Thermoplasmata archaeon]|nr:twin-arginine translocase subunit TatC [Thermoplasmata archaeon]